ncbi:MAG TPA: aminotransferase class I/II-fold pyridoxal phosphate-dependent enzyme [Actinomycetota bacterium]|jgi:aspartate aminotransferase
MSEGRISRQLRTELDELQPLMRFFDDSAWSKRQHEPGICDFVAGNPHEPPLPELVESLRSATVPRSDTWFAYPMSEPDARETVSGAIRERLGMQIPPDDVLMTTGAFGAFAALFPAIADPGDEVVYLKPPWFFYASMIRMAGATPVGVSLEPPAFDLDPDAIASVLTERTRAVLINTPQNPTGRIYAEQELDRLAGVLTERSERNGRPVYLVSDEAYRHIRYDDRPFVSPTSRYPSSFMVYTYGKTLLAPGERIGYIAFPPGLSGKEELRDAIKLSQMSGGWLFPNTVLQHALPETDRYSIDIKHLEAKRDRMVDALRGMGYELQVPEGTFYLLPKAPISDDLRFTEMLAEHDVFVLPGALVDLPGYFRVSLTASEEMIERSLAGFEAARRAAT